MYSGVLDVPSADIETPIPCTDIETTSRSVLQGSRYQYKGVLVPVLYGYNL